MNEPVWIQESYVMAIHEAEIAEHGGLNGVRDLAIIQSALSRPVNLWHHGDSPDIAVLAAAYAYGICRNHGIFDGNKRTAFVIAESFLNRNGYELATDDAEIVRVMLAVADGSMAEAALAEWIRSLRAAIATNESRS
jgi:death-on-curing protein